LAVSYFYETELCLTNILTRNMILVSSASNTGSEKIFILEGRLFMYVMKSKGPRIDPWGTLYCINFQSVALCIMACEGGD